MRLLVCLLVATLATTALVVSATEQQQQRILRRVIKSTPTATNLGRVRLVTVRSSGTERGAVSEITSKEAAAFGQRSANETTTQASPTKTQQASTSAPTTTTTTTLASSSPAPASQQQTSTTQAVQVQQQQQQNKVSERQQVASATHEVELLASAPTSWQTMTAVEAPAALLIAAGTRPAIAPANDLSSSSSEESVSTGDFLRSASKSGTSSFASGESFSRIRQQSSKTSQQREQQQQSFFYPQQQQQQQQQQQRAQSKTSQQATKTYWYQPSTTARPAPIIQQQYEQQNEQYVEQQQQLIEGAAPLGQAEPFAFDFNTQDNSGNGQYRKEESDKNGVVRGSYGYTDANGIYRHVEYVADHNGFRANIKSNEPGLIGETQPASIQMAGGPAASQRFSASSSSSSSSSNEASDWSASSSASNERADLAVASPDFESSHKSERLRAPRHFRN